MTHIGNDLKDPAPLDRDAFRSVGELAALQVASARCGSDLPVLLRDRLLAEGGVRTFVEIWAEHDATAAEIRAALRALEDVGAVHRRDLVMDHLTEPCWWAVRQIGPLPVGRGGR